MFKIGFNIDRSLVAQPRLQRCLNLVVNWESECDDLRLWANDRGQRAFRKKLTELRRRHPGPWMSFLGSGDFHHLSLLLLESLERADKSITLVTIDNHPDWFDQRPRYHCGNWVAGAISSARDAYLIGPTSADLDGWKLRLIPFEALCQGRIKLFPYYKKKIFVPFKRPASFCNPMKRRLFGSTLAFESVQNLGAGKLFEKIAAELRGRSVYLSIDKDCLSSEFIETDWEQGAFSPDELIAGVRALVSEVDLVGVDICGEQAPVPLKGLIKRIDARRFFSSHSRSRSRLVGHETLNLALMSAISDDGEERAANLE